jgi:hypothetical protein
MDNERLARLEEKLNNFIFLEDCDNLISVKTKRLVLDYMPDMEVKIRTLLQLYDNEKEFHPETLCATMCEIFNILGLTEKLAQKETQYYVIGKTFNGLVYTKFMFDMMTRFLCFLFTNTSTHVFTVHDLTPLTTLQCLTTLSIRNNNIITDLTPIETLTTIARVDFVNCNSIKNFNPISKLVKLTELIIIGNEFLTNLQFLNNLPLVSLYILNGQNLVDISIVANQLSHVSFIGCGNINNLGTLTSLPVLKRLELGKCTGKDLNFLRDLLSVEELILETETDNIIRPPNVKYINGVAVN